MHKSVNCLKNFSAMSYPLDNNKEIALIQLPTGSPTSNDWVMFTSADGLTRLATFDDFQAAINEDAAASAAAAAASAAAAEAAAESITQWPVGDSNGLNQISFPEGFNINGGFTAPYRTFSWIAPPVQSNPTLNVQGIYTQLRMAGNLGGLVHDAVAAEWRGAGVSNTGAGQSAFEASTVISGSSANNVNLLVSVLANFHTEGTPTGVIDRKALFMGTQTPPLPAGFTINTHYGMYLEEQIVGTNNFTFYGTGGRYVLKGKVEPKDTTSRALILKGLVGQDSEVSIFAMENGAGATLFQFFANGTGGVGGRVSGPSFYVNNNIATPSTVNMALKAIAGQTADQFRFMDSSNNILTFFDAAGHLSVGFAASMEASANIQSNGTTRGVLLNRMTSTQRDAIASPANSLLVFDTTLSAFGWYSTTDSRWKAVGGKTVTSAVSVTKSYLNTNYPTAMEGFTIRFPLASGGAVIAMKEDSSATGEWQLIAAPRAA